MARTEFGSILRKKRKEMGLTAQELAEKIGLSRPYVSRMEGGRLKPTPDVLEKLISILQLKEAEISLVSNSRPGPELTKSREDRVLRNLPPSGMAAGPAAELKFRVPEGLRVLYSDVINVTTDEFGMTLDIAQKLGPTGQVDVVARIGISLPHAKRLVEIISKRLKEKGVVIDS